MAGAAFDWGKEAVPADAPTAEAAPFDWAKESTPDISKTESALRGASQGLTLGKANAIAGGAGYFMEGVDRLKRLAGGDVSAVNPLEAYQRGYVKNRDESRARHADAMKANPKTYLGADVVGSMLLPLGTARTLGKAVTAGAAFGAASGHGHSTSDSLGGQLADTAIGAGAGAVGGAAGHGIGKVAGIGLDKVKALLERVRGRADKGIAEAREKAVQMSTEKAAENLKTLRGAAGGEGQKAARLVENIRNRQPHEGMAAPEEQARMLRAAAAEAIEKAAQIGGKLKAAGVDEVIDGAGAFVTPSAKAGRALAAKPQQQKMEEAARAMLAEADELERGLASAAPDDVASMVSRARRSPEMALLENQVLRHNVEDLPEQAAKALAARRAFQGASQDFGADVAKGADEILSGKAAKQAAMGRALRYGPPLAASAAGAMFGGPIGAVVGAGAGLAAGRGLEALAGAGMRPALRSWINLFTKYPAVQNAAWRSVRKLASTNPDALGPFGDRLASAAARSPAALEEAHQQLLGDPGYIMRLVALVADEEREKLAVH